MARAGAQRGAEDIYMDGQDGGPVMRLYGRLAGRHNPDE